MNGLPKKAVVQRCSVKNVFLEILQNWQENTCARVFLIKLQASKLIIKTLERRFGVFIVNYGTCNFIKKKALAQVFFCEFCKISKNTFFHRTPLVAASVTN